MTSATTVSVCVTCRAKGAATDDPTRPGEMLLTALEAAHLPDVMVEPVKCFSVCKRACTVMVGSAGKWSYLLADIDENEHLPDLITYIQAHQAHPTGILMKEAWPEVIRQGKIARIPPELLRA